MIRQNNLWQGTFAIWQNQEFAKIYAQFSQRKLFLLNNAQIYLSHQPLIGASTLYLYQITNQDIKLGQIKSMAKNFKPAKIWLYSLRPQLSLKRFFIKEYPTFVINLQNKEAKLWQDIGPKTRNMIRKGEKMGLDIKLAKTESKFKQWWSIYANASKNKGFGQQNFHLVKNLFQNKNLAKLFLVIKDGKVIGGCFFLMDRYPMYWLGSFDPQYRQFSPGHLNIWQAMLYFKKTNTPLLDPGGADLCNKDGSTKFKKSFQGEIKKGYIYEIPIINWKNLILKIYTHRILKTD